MLDTAHNVYGVEPELFLQRPFFAQADSMFTLDLLAELLESDSGYLLYRSRPSRELGQPCRRPPSQRVLSLLDLDGRT